MSTGNLYRDRRLSTPDVETLRQIAVLAPLSEASLRRLAAAARCGSYPNGEELPVSWCETEPIVCCVVQGSMYLAFRAEEGNEQVASRITAGGCFDWRTEGWAPPDETVASVSSATALLCAMPYQLFEEEVIGCPEAARRLFAAHRDWRRDVGGVASDQMHSPATRVRRALWRDTHTLPDHAISYTHQALADRAGTDRPSTSRVIGELRQRGVIETTRNGHRIIVLDLDALLDDR